MKAIVTGGAGLIGSTICEKLLQKEATVLCLDNFTLGTRRHIESFVEHPQFQFEEVDVSRSQWYSSIDLLNSSREKWDVIFHLAANSDISLGREKPEHDFRLTLQTTFETLEFARRFQIPNVIFSSSSAVYGANPPLPTPEDMGEMNPVSLYGAGKFASESYISAYVENYGLNAWVFRFGNVVGKRLTHGVIYDFIHKLKKNPDALEVLGDGTQCKTYIDVEDCADGILHAFEKSPAGRTHPERFQVFNLSTQGRTTVREIAELTCETVTKGQTQIQFGTHSVGWIGDVPQTSLLTEKIEALGWKPQIDSTEAVVKSIQDYHQWSL